MEEPEDNMSGEGVRNNDSQSAVKKPKKRSMVERELETSLTARVTSPAVIPDAISTSRYGRPRRLKTECELIESQKTMLAAIKSPGHDSTPVKTQSPVYRMHASNSPRKAETPKKTLENSLDNQIDNIYQENISLSRFSDDAASPSPAKKFPKVYIRKDLIQKREAEETIMLIKNLFSPSKSSTKTNLSSGSDDSSEKSQLNQNGHVGNASVVKTLDFDGNKRRKRESRESKPSMSKNDLFELEAKCPYQVGDLAWARMGTFPFWPCIITMDPYSEMFVKKKLFGRIEHDIIHVTFFGDNGRRSWIVDNMLRNYLGQLEFETTREKFTVEDKKKDPKLYAAFFISEKKQALWNTSVEEAETLLCEPKRLRVDLFNDMLWKSRASKKNQKSGRITRTDSDVSLSESLYDSLFSEEEVKADDSERSKNRTRNKSFDVSEVVTACLDNMAAKTGITKIQRQSHMDRWLQKAKSKTPEKTQVKTVPVPLKVEKPDKPAKLPVANKKNGKSDIKKRQGEPPSIPAKYTFRKRKDSASDVTLIDDSKESPKENIIVIDDNTDDVTKSKNSNSNPVKFDLGVITKIDPDEDEVVKQSSTAVTTIDDDDTVKDDIKPVEANCEISVIDKQLQQNASKVNLVKDDNSDAMNSSNHQPIKNDVTSVTANSNVSDSNQVSAMEVDDNESANSLVLDKTEKSEISEAKDMSAMEVDEENSKNQLNDDNSSLNPKTVSNESVENYQVVLNNDECIMKSDTDMKDTKNVTIEASVTETKDEDALNNQAEGTEQQSDEQKLVENSEINKFIDFLDVSNSTNMAETRYQTSDPKNSTPQKYKEYDKINPTINVTFKINLENQGLNLSDAGFFDDENFSLQNSKDKSSKVDLNTKAIHSNEADTKEDTVVRRELQKVNNTSIDHLTKDEDLEIDNVIEKLNKSGNSESILQISDEIHNFDNVDCYTKDETHKNNFDPILNENEKQESDLENSQTCVASEKNDVETEAIKDNLNNSATSNLTENNNDCSTRQEVESPTFTQLLESEEFFRDVNETCDSAKNNIGQINEKFTEQLETTYEVLKNIDSIVKLTENQEITNAVGKKPYIKQVDQNKPPVETDKVSILDEDESSEDEPSPEYESFDEDTTEDFRKHMMSIENNITDKKDEEQIVKICIEIAEKAKLSPIKYGMDMGVSKPNVKLDVSFKENLETCTKYRLATSPNTRLASNQTHNFDSNVSKETISEISSEHIVKMSTSERNSTYHKNKKESELMVNGDTIAKISYRTRLSTNSITKERASPDIQMSDNIKQLRKSCEYEPKVVIMRLERDKIKSLRNKDNKSKFIVEEKTKTKNDKMRLSLRRVSPKNKHIEYEIVKSVEPEIKSEVPNYVEPISSHKKNETGVFNKAPKKVDIENCPVETNIPESIKVNGYHHVVVDRKYTDTPDLIDDTDFDIDAVSLNSEDSEISLTNSVESVPKRSLRSRPERTLEYALKNPDFLKYLELRQDYLMDEHPELNEDEVVSYVYKTWQYEEDLKSDRKKIDDPQNLIKGHKQESPLRKSSKKSQPKNNIENYFREKYEKCKNTYDFDAETSSAKIESCEMDVKHKIPSESPVIFAAASGVEQNRNKTEVSGQRKTRSKSPDSVDFTCKTSNDVFIVKDKYKDLETVCVNSEENLTPKRNLRSKAITPKSLKKEIIDFEEQSSREKVKEEREFDNESISSEDSEIPLRQLRSKVLNENKTNGIKKETTPEKKIETTFEHKVPILAPDKVKEEVDETGSTVSDNEPLLKQKKKKVDKRSLEDPEFVKYLELRQDALMDENPQLSQNEIVSYLYKTWLYEENSKSDLKKNEELEQANLVKGLNTEIAPTKKVRRKPKAEKQTEDVVVPKEKPRRRIIQPYYNENISDIEDELEVFEIFKTKKTPITVVTKAEPETDTVKSPNATTESSILRLKTERSDVIEYRPTPTTLSEPMKQEIEIIDVDIAAQTVDEVELYFIQLTTPKPNVFKGLIREKVCEICEVTGNLVKCKGCNGMFHPECVQKEKEVVEKEVPMKGRKKKRKLVRKTKSFEDSGSHSDEKSQDVSADMSIEDLPPEIRTFDADAFESQLAVKMKELLNEEDANYDYYSSDDDIDWKDAVAGKCEIVDVKLKPRNAPVDYSDFKCNNCQKYDVPVCFVCKAAVSKNDVKMRQKCHVAHCHKYYHLECLDHWPQTQFNSGEPSRSNKKINEFFEALTCPRHVCHTCVSDDPRGCKTRFSGDKLAKCVRCPATYHSFNKCLPAGSQILTASHIICPRHSDPKSGKVPCHVNTGWCFICALGGSLICCEYCPTSFHAECLNIKPPEGNYMCEDCETGRLPLYGEMVWVKLGHYRWWPAKILYPSEIPENIMAVKHSLGDFVVRFFGQYDHYWVNRGRVFPYQEGDSGRVSSQKSKIDADFTLAIEHAQRAYAILKSAEPNEEESLDIASSLLPPHYVKLKCNKPCGSLCGRKVEDPSLSLTQCECNPDEPDPCGPYSQCLNRMLLTECGPTCRAGDRCNNRAFEKRLYPKLTPYRTPHRGWGLKTLEDIKAGQFVIEYVGELIDEEEFRRRMRRKHEIRDENFYFLTLDKERMIDAGPKGNAARFMNHCCEPNCETQKWTVLGDVRVGLFAIDNIPANSEVTFNYNLECAGIEKKRCLCGAKRCSGYIGAKPKQGESQSKKNKPGKLPAKRTYKKKKIEESPSTSKLKAKKPVGRPPKPKELTEIEKDLLIIKSATNVSSDESSRSQSIDDKHRSLKRKRVSISTDEVSLCNGLEPSEKKIKCEEKQSEVGD